MVQQQLQTSHHGFWTMETILRESTLLSQQGMMLVFNARFQCSLAPTVRISICASGRWVLINVIAGGYFY